MDHLDRFITHWLSQLSWSGDLARVDVELLIVYRDLSRYREMTQALYDDPELELISSELTR